MDMFTIVGIAFGIGVLVGIVYAQIQVTLVSDRYEEKLRRMEDNIKTAFHLYMKGE